MGAYFCWVNGLGGEEGGEEEEGEGFEGGGMHCCGRFEGLACVLVLFAVVIGF